MAVTDSQRCASLARRRASPKTASSGRLSPWRFAPGLGADMTLQPRERRTIWMGTLVTATALGLAFAVVPAARRFATREELLDARRAEITRLRGLIHDEASLRQQLAERTARARSAPRRVLSARTAALAAPDLQPVLRGLAESAPLARSSLAVPR